jgi:hypothetical protein
MSDSSLVKRAESWRTPEEARGWVAIYPEMERAARAMGRYVRYLAERREAE